MGEDGTVDFAEFSMKILTSEDMADKLKTEEMRCKPKQIDEMLRDNPHFIFKDDPNYKFWKWLKPLEVNDFYTFDEEVTGASDNHRIFNDFAVFQSWQVVKKGETEEQDEHLEYSGMRHKTNETAHGIVRVVNRERSTITECCYKNDTLHGLFRKFEEDTVFIRVYKNGEVISHQTYERNLTRRDESGNLATLISEVCWPADLKIK